MTTSRNPNIQYDAIEGVWSFKPEYLLTGSAPPYLPKQWNPAVSQLEHRLRQVERQNQLLLTNLLDISAAIQELVKRPGLTALDVSKLLEFTETDKTTLDALLAGNIINRIVALES
jgi:hypothetical protein